MPPKPKRPGIQPTQFRLTPEELNQLLVMHLNWLHGKGLMPEKAVDQRQTIDTPVVIAEDTLIGYLLGESERAGIEMLEDVDIVAVTEASTTGPGQKLSRS